MITTLTLNPCLDYIVEVDKFEAGKINRTKSEMILPGGKGINVSQVLTNLSVDNLAIGIVAGFSGQELVRILKERGINSKMYWVESGFTRINAKIRSIEETALNGMGPKITEKEVEDFLAYLENIETDILVLAGKIPASLDDDLYIKIIKAYKGKAEIVVDATKDQLLNCIPYKPFLIKPNEDELGELFGEEVKNKEDAIRLSKKLQEKGARNVLVSMGKDGAVLILENGSSYWSNAPKGRLVNSVGAGDSMVAGFLYGYRTFKDMEVALKYGLAAGSASAFSEELAKKEEIEKLAREIKIKRF